MLVLVLSGISAAPGHAGTALLHGTGVTAPAGSVILGNDLWVSDFLSGFCRLDPVGDGTFAINATTCSTAAGQPGQPTFDPATNSVYVPDASSQSLGVYRLTYNPGTRRIGSTTLLRPGTMSELRATSTALGRDGKLYVGFEKTAAIMRITNPSGPTAAQAIENFGQTSDGGPVQGLAFAGSDLYIAQEFGVTRILSPDLCDFCIAGATSVTASGPTAIASNGSDLLWIANTPFGATEILRYRISTATQDVYTTTGRFPDGTEDSLFFVRGLSVDVAGNIYIGDDATDGAGVAQGRIWFADTVAPNPPSFTATSPASPANNNAPNIQGSAEAGSTVRLYTNTACTTLAGTGSAAAFSSPGLAVSVPNDASRTFHATATDAVGNVSACSTTSITYVEDSTAPNRPQVRSVSPVGPANNNSPQVLGTAEIGSTVRVHTDAACATPQVASAPESAFVSPGISVSVSDNTSTTFRARAIDAAGNISACSSTSVTYVEDSTAGPPAFSATVPASPANDNAPRVKGTADPGSTVNIYTNSACTTLATSGTEADFSSTGLAVSVPSDQATTFWGRIVDVAGNISACSSASITYVEDSTANPPTVSATVPASPANDNGPRVKGTAEAGATVNLYTNSACTTLATSGTEAAFSSTGLSVSVPGDQATTFWGQIVDRASNLSSCSTASITYVEDSTATPPTFSATVPASPANENAPRVKGAAEAGATVNLYTNSACTSLATSGTEAAFSSTGLAVSVPSDQATTFWGRIVDRAGNLSSCSTASITYVEDSTATPPTFSATVPASPANDDAPRVKGTAEAGSTVNLFTDSACTIPAASGTEAAFSTTGLAVSVPSDQATTFWGRMVDQAGNLSACSTDSITYMEDSSAPAPPTFAAATSPASPANDNSPKVLGTAEDASTVRLYTDAACTDAAGLPGSAAAFASPGLGVSVDNDSESTFHATATDQAGNASACSTSAATYVEDSTAPTLTLDSLAPNSPANDNSPRIFGTTEADATVRIFKNAACTLPADVVGSGSELASGLAAGVPDDSTTSFRVTATDAAGNRSSCAGPLTYIEDSTGIAPVFTGTSPGSGANNNAPRIRGQAEPGTVELFTDAACLVSAGSGSSSEFESPGIAVAVADDSTTTFHAKVTDTVGNVSACSTSSITYEEDSLEPSPPTFSATLPASPSNDNAPRVQGAAEAGSTVNLFTDSGCTVLATSGNATAFNSTGLSVSVPSDQATTFYGQIVDQGSNVSACSTDSITYTEDSTPPPAPTTAPDLATSSDTGSSRADNVTQMITPTFLGRAAAGGKVRLLVDGLVKAEGFADGAGNYSLTSSTLAEGIRSVTAANVDQAGNQSAASPALSVRIDTTPPTSTPKATPTRLSPNGDGLADRTTITATLSEPAVSWTVLVRTSDLTRQILAVTGSGTAVSAVWDGTEGGAPLPEGGYRYSVYGRDAAGNAKSIHGSLYLDTTAPSATLSATPNPFAPATHGSATIAVRPAETAYVKVSLFNSAGTRVLSFPTASVLGGTTKNFLWTGTNSKGIALPAGVYQVVATLTDLAENTSSTSTSLTLVR